MKSSSCVGMAHKPICSSCAARLLLIVVVVFGAGEFIVGLQIVWPDIEQLSLRMVTEIERERCVAILAAQQECDGGSARRVALQGFHDGAAQSGTAILLQ